MPFSPFRRKSQTVTEATEQGSASVEKSPPTGHSYDVQGSATTTTARLNDLLIVTHLVPANDVLALLPEGLSADRLPGPEGEPVAFLQVMFALYQRTRWSPLPEIVGDSFYQISYRILTQRYEGKTRIPGFFLVRTFASTSERHISRRIIDREADFARFSVFVDGDPARNQYQTFRVRAEGELGQTQLQVQALSEPPAPPAPFGKTEDMVAFLTQREDQYFRSSLPGRALGKQTIRHAPLTPQFGNLVSARLTPWLEKKLLTPDTTNTPLVVLMQPSLTVHATPPVLARLLLRTTGEKSEPYPTPATDENPI